MWKENGVWREGSGPGGPLTEQARHHLPMHSPLLPQSPAAASVETLEVRRTLGVNAHLALARRSLGPSR